MKIAVVSLIWVTAHVQSVEANRGKASAPRSVIRPQPRTPSASKPRFTHPLDVPIDPLISWELVDWVEARVQEDPQVQPTARELRLAAGIPVDMELTASPTSRFSERFVLVVEALERDPNFVPDLEQWGASFGCSPLTLRRNLLVPLRRMVPQYRLRLSDRRVTGLAGVQLAWLDSDPSYTFDGRGIQLTDHGIVRDTIRDAVLRSDKPPLGKAIDLLRIHPDAAERTTALVISNLPKRRLGEKATTSPGFENAIAEVIVHGIRSDPSYSVTRFAIEKDFQLTEPTLPRVMRLLHERLSPAEAMRVAGNSAMRRRGIAVAFLNSNPDALISVETHSRYHKINGKQAKNDLTWVRSSGLLHYEGQILTPTSLAKVARQRETVRAIQQNPRAMVVPSDFQTQHRVTRVPQIEDFKVVAALLGPLDALRISANPRERRFGVVFRHVVDGGQWNLDRHLEFFKQTRMRARQDFQSMIKFLDRNKELLTSEQLSRIILRDGRTMYEVLGPNP